MAETEKKARKPFAFYFFAEVLLAALFGGASVLCSFAPFRENFLLGSYYAIGAVFLTVLFAAAGAFYLLTRLNAFWFTLPLVCGLAVAVIRRTVTPGVLFFFGVVLAYTFALGIRKRKKRLFTAVCGAIVIALLIAALAFACAYETIGTDGIMRIGDYLADAKSEIHRGAQWVSDEMQAAVEQNALAQTSSVLVLDLSAQTVDRLIKAFVMTLPGYLAALCLTFSYFATFLIRLVLKRMRVLNSMYPDGFYPEPSIAGAVVFALCLIFSAIAGDSLNVFSCTVANLAAPLSFVFAMTGLAVLARRFSRRRFPSGILIFLALALLFWFGSAGVYRSSVLPMLAVSVSLFVSGVLFPVLYFLGLFSTIWQTVKSYREKRS